MPWYNLISSVIITNFYNTSFNSYLHEHHVEDVKLLDTDDLGGLDLQRPTTAGQLAMPLVLGASLQGIDKFIYRFGPDDRLPG